MAEFNRPILSDNQVEGSLVKKPIFVHWFLCLCGILPLGCSNSPTLDNNANAKNYDPKSLVEEKIRELHREMRSGDKERQLAVLNSTIPNESHFVELFGSENASKIWPFYENYYAEMRDNYHQVVDDFIRGGELKSISLANIRETRPRDYALFFAIVPEDIPFFFATIDYERRASGMGDFIVINGQVVFIRGLRHVPEYLESLEGNQEKPKH